jgi:biopolymer transport protein ExbD
VGMNINSGDGEGPDGPGDAEAPETVVAEINITPLTDVFLVLLIIFMVTTTAVVDAEKAARDGVKVALPKADAAGPVTSKRAVPILTITKTGDLYLFARKISPETLEGEIKKALADGQSETLLIRGDQSVLLGSAVNVMSTAKRAGAKNIGILTQPGK